MRHDLLEADMESRLRKDSTSNHYESAPNILKGQIRAEHGAEPRCRPTRLTNDLNRSMAESRLLAFVLLMRQSCIFQNNREQRKIEDYLLN